MTDERYEVTRLIEAPAAKIFAVLSDPKGHVRIDASGMLQSAEGAPVTKVGDTFTVHMDREALGDLPMGKYTVQIHITRFEPDAVIEWTVTGTRNPPINQFYGYELSPSGTGTTVTSYYDWSRIEPRYREIIGFPVIADSTLKATLGILARTVE
ncbi:MAG TPA: SRPBCC family protein [Mycobacteriales bacterium]|jgi:hypothetical protein|nr:SRPBCC family protein [Mycobacteriales bacterium]